MDVLRYAMKGGRTYLSWLQDKESQKAQSL